MSRAAEEVKRILGKKDCYEILGIERADADDAKVKKAYKKLALLLHPDKCSEEGAEDAFKLVSASYKCLSTEESRRHYNMTGTDADDSSGGMGGMNGAANAEMFEEIFREMFRQHGGGMPGNAGGRMPGGMGHGAFPFPGGVHMGGMGGTPFVFNMGGLGGRGRGSRDGGENQEDGGLNGLRGLNLPSLPYPLSLIPFQVWALLALYLFSQVVFALLSVLANKMLVILPLFFFAPANVKWQCIGLVILLSLLGFI